MTRIIQHSIITPFIALTNTRVININENYLEIFGEQYLCQQLIN
ncbi:hypothetical protein BSPLISOX_2754 [uncultured Gammaproteobacteria bacterium]|nr:hypothetical protein BSPLISOX_2754 [uncultured Gammaproteobacteria bacterium]